MVNVNNFDHPAGRPPDPRSHEDQEHRPWHRPETLFGRGLLVTGWSFVSSVSGFFAVTDQCICVDETIECAWLLCMNMFNQIV